MIRVPARESPLDTPWEESADVVERDADKTRLLGGQRASSSSPHSLWTPQYGGLKLLGVDLTLDVVCIMLVYFVQGVLGLSRLAVSFFLKDDLGMGPAEVAALMGVTSLPWLVKPLYGLLSDSVPIFGYRRRSYLFISGAANTVSWTLLAVAVNTPTEALACLTMGSLCVAVSDVVVDGMVVQRVRRAADLEGEDSSRGVEGGLQSLCWGSCYAGGILTASASGSLVGSMGPRSVFGWTAMLPLITTMVALVIAEERSAEGKSVSARATIASIKRQMKSMWGAIRLPGISLPVIFLFAFQSTPNVSETMFYFFTNDLGFQPEFLGNVRLATAVASLAGVGAYNLWFKHWPLRKLFRTATVLGCALSSTQLLLVTHANRSLGISDSLFVLSDDVIISVLGEISFMPVLVLAARLCPKGSEATLFAALMSVVNGGAASGRALGGLLTHIMGVTDTDFYNLPALVALCSVSGFVPLLLLRFLPPEENDQNL